MSTKIQVAIITPYKVASEFAYRKLQLLLPKTLLHSQEYCDLFSSANRGPDQLVILDNGAAEGEIKETTELLQAASLIEPDVIVAPDDLFSGSNTKAMTHKFLKSDDFLRYCDTHGRPEIMVVPHGNSLSQWKTSLLDLLEYSPSWIGIAKIHSTLSPTGCITGRLDLVRIVNSLDLVGIRIHLLGLDLPPTELMIISEKASAKHTISVDTAMPWAFAQQGLTMNIGYGFLKRPSDLHSDEDWNPTREEVNIAKWNILVIEGMAGGVSESAAYANR